MKTTEELEEIYDSEPYEWIALWKNRGVWVKITNPSFIHECHYQLIHIKHKEVLEAYLADDKVEIKFYLPYVMCTDDTELEATWEVDDNFIENYNPDLEYRLKEKEDEHSSTSGDTDTTMDNSVDADNKVYKMTIPIIEVDEEMDREIDKYLSKQDGYRESELDLDTFNERGFETPAFKGKIYELVDDVYFGRVWNNKEDKWKPKRWNLNGSVFGAKELNYYDLTPIKKHWYDDPANFPVRLVRDTEQYVTYRWIHKREDFIKAHRQGFKLVTED